MGRYKTTGRGDDSLGQIVMALATGGISLLFGNKTTYHSKVRDNASGKSYTGYGSSYGKAKKSAVSGLRNGKGKKW